MNQATLTLTPTANQDSVSGYQSVSKTLITREQQVTITLDGADNEVTGHLFFLVIGAIAVAGALSGCEVKTTTTVNNNMSVNVGGSSSQGAGNGSGSGSGSGGRPQ